MLNNKWKAKSSDFRQVRQKGPNVFRPEHKPVNLLRREGHVQILLVVWVYSLAVAGPKAVNKPVTVEGWYVRLVTGRNDHARTPTVSGLYDKQHCLSA